MRQNGNVGTTPTVSVLLNTSFKEAELFVDEPLSKQTEIELFDILGKKITGIYNGILPKGRYTFNISKGIYTAGEMLFVRVTQANFVKTEKIVLKN